MKLIITQLELEAIVRAHVLNTVSLREGSDLKIDFTATRGEDGIVATIDIPYMGVASIPAIAEALDRSTQQQDTVTVPLIVETPVAKPTRTRATATVVPKAAGSILGGGTTPATEQAQNPEPVAEAAQEAAGDAVVETEVEAQADVSDATEEAAPAAPAGPSLFGPRSTSFLAK